jgi:C1A family cysteine protease
MTNDEWRSTFLMPKGVIQNYHTPETAVTFPEGFQAPTNMTWVGQGVTNSILNQGQCGSCWAFSTVESINSAYALFNKVTPIPNLSEQQVVSCSILYGNMGCGGGNVVPAYRYVMAHPLTTNQNYPYTSGTTTKTGVCNTSLQSAGTWKVYGYKTVPTNDCDTLQNTIATQPTSVCVDASTWQNYKSGIFSNCGTQLDHCVLGVGYVQGSYWQVQNQWGTDWGEQGFIQLKWGNTCGVCQQAQIPTTTSS